jgi:hypothetical protein
MPCRCPITISFRLLFAGLLLAASAVSAEEKTATADPDRSPPIAVCAPRFSTPLFVPAEEVLRQAARKQPVTSDGWIVQNRPVSSCDRFVGTAEQRAYELWEKPLQLRRYDAQIRLLQAELGSLQRKLQTYHYFNKAGALPVTVENTQLAILAAEERLKLARDERMLFLRWQNLERQLQSGVTLESR